MGNNQPLTNDTSPLTPAAPVSEALRAHVADLLKELLAAHNRRHLEQYRVYGSTNRIYRVPVDSAGKEFVIVKLPSSPLAGVKTRVKRFIRNWLYREHDVAIGRKHAYLEIEHLKEWAAEGLAVPPVVEVSLPGIRVMKELPYPTLLMLLEDQGISEEEKLQMVALTTKALSSQHKTAYVKGKKRLIHRDPGPWNILFDPATRTTYWIDLEHPVDYPKMTLETVMSRALRIFLMGVIDYVSPRWQDVVKIVAWEYELKNMLVQCGEGLQGKHTPLLGRLLQYGITRRRYLQKRRVAAYMGQVLEREIFSMADKQAFGPLKETAFFHVEMAQPHAPITTFPME